jgi:hypothetical protein
MVNNILYEIHTHNAISRYGWAIEEGCDTQAGGVGIRRRVAKSNAKDKKTNAYVITRNKTQRSDERLVTHAKFFWVMSAGAEVRSRQK